MMAEPSEKTEQQWRSELTAEQYRVTRGQGTEPPFTGTHNANKQDGIYRCVCCGEPVFDALQKYDSGTGWPSFWAPITEQAVETQQDASLGMKRTEVHCPRCSAHLGHVFEDGPEPTGLRYCINSIALGFEPR